MGEAVIVSRDGAGTRGEGCGMGFAVGVIAGVGAVLGRGKLVVGLSRNVFLVGGCVCPSIHWFRLAGGLIGARVSVEAGGEGGVAGDFRGGWADIFAVAMGLRGEEARGFFLRCTAA